MHRTLSGWPQSANVSQAEERSQHRAHTNQNYDSHSHRCDSPASVCKTIGPPDLYNQKGLLGKSMISLKIIQADMDPSLVLGIAEINATFSSFAFVSASLWACAQPFLALALPAQL